MNALLYRKLFLTLLLACGLHTAAHAQVAASSDTWFKVEVTVFLYEDANLDAENWSPNKLSVAFPERLQRLKQVSDFLQLSDWSVFATTPPPTLATRDLNTLETLEPETPETPLVGPPDYAPKTISFRLPDLARTAFLQLPVESHDFIGTNRAITQSATHRIVFHGVWHQLMTRRAAANAVAVMGGRRFNQRREVEGSLSFYLSNNGDRIIAQSDLWLNRFGTQAEAESPWILPVLPTILLEQPQDDDAEQTPYYVNRIIQFQQSRDLRAREFHYLDHPAMGMLVQVSPYTLPPLPLPPLEGSVDIPGAVPAGSASQLP